MLRESFRPKRATAVGAVPGRRMTIVVLACLLAAGAAGCGSSSKHPSVSASAIASMRLCLRHHGYAISPESTAVRATAPRRFEFVSVWNLLNLDRVALAVTISRTAKGAQRAAVWTRRANEKLGKGVVRAPVVRIGRFDALWTAEPGEADEEDVYGCLRASS